MFVDGRSLGQQTLEADICIIGGGAAGITMASEFIGAKSSVILLESGDIEPDSQTQSLYEAENVSRVKFPIETTRLRYFGGTTNHWGGTTPRLDEVDFSPRPNIPTTGWPISLSDLDPFYARAQTLCQTGHADTDDPNLWQQRAGFTPIKLGNAPLTIGVNLESPPTRFGKVYRDRLRQAQNVTVALNSNVQELISNPAASHVGKVDVKCIGGTRFEVRAKTFVVAVGAMETPRLLLLSRQQQPAGLGNTHDLVGRYYMDHCGLTGGQLQPSPSAPSFEFFHLRKRIGEQIVLGYFAPSAEAMRRENIGNFRMILYPTQSEPALDSLREIADSPGDARTLGQLGYHIGNVLVDIDQVTNLVYKNLFRLKTGFLGNDSKSKDGAAGQSLAARSIMHVSAEQFPNRESRVLLSDRTDLFGQQRIKLDWRIGDADRRTLVRSMELFAASISAAGLGRVRIGREIAENKFDSLIEIACHHMGTTRMSDDPKTGVVDRNCRVHGIDNLYIASSSIFPTSGAANPTLSIVAFALRLADHLKLQYA